MISVDAVCLLAAALRARINELAAQSHLPVTLARSGRWQSAWETASPPLRKRILSHALGLKHFRLTTGLSDNLDIAVLPRQSLQRVLLLRALYARTAALRRCVERKPRQWFIQQLGQSDWNWIVSRYAPPTDETLLPIGDDHLHQWYADGWQRLYCDRIWAWQGLAHLAANVADVTPRQSLDGMHRAQRSHAFLDEWRLMAQPRVVAA